ncbi:hypothetical protein [Flavobacterium sp.]|jgi:integrase|uniref:hypothetical protein n=1 Tax=Flavobacterium sp. TaxID=239 RepID=UPI0037C04F4A
MRPKTTARDLPPRLLRRTKKSASGKEWVFYVYNGRDDNGKRKEFHLGSNLNEAKRKWAELECVAAPVETGLMGYIFDRYTKEVIPTKSPRTQSDNTGEMIRIRAAFGKMPIDAIEPKHIAQYLDKRTAKTRGNREMALMSHVWNKARAWGYTSKTNPCAGIEKNKEVSRSFYADEAVYTAVYQHACQELKDAMDLAYLTAQRVADVRTMTWGDVIGDALVVTPNKTRNSSRKKMRILLKIDGVPTELGKLLDRIKANRGTVQSIYIVATPKGAALTKWTQRVRWDDARKDAAEAVKESDPALATRIREFRFMDIRPKAASETKLSHAQALLGHTKEQITKVVYQRVGETVCPTK